MEIYTFGHSARSLEEFKNTLDRVKIDLIVDLRRNPISRYYPHFNRLNLEKIFGKNYIFGGNYLGGSPEFHNDLLEYISNKGIKMKDSNNKLFELIDIRLKEKIFSGDEKFSNNEKRKFWITSNFLSEYIPESSDDIAINFLKNLLIQFPNKRICFFCSEKEPTHCHRYHLLEEKWSKKINGLKVFQIENMVHKKQNISSSQTRLF